MKVFAMFALAAAIGTSGCMGTSISDPTAGGGAASSPPPVASNPFPNFGIAVNAYRAPGLNPLAYNAQLHSAAQGHATDMSVNSYFSHTGLNGSSPGDRITAAGYTWGWYGENIARGQADADAALTAWKNSPGHNAILLNSNPTEFALAWAPGNYWVMVLARPY